VISIGKIPGPLCYVPAPDLIRKLQPALQDTLRLKYKEMGILPR
jgi:hypothetical protein